MERVRRWQVGTVALALSLLPVGDFARAATGSQPALPTSMAALGDSISRGFDACGFYVDCTERSWSTGADGDVDSQAIRLSAAGAHLSTVANFAHTGATVAALTGQATAAVAAKVDYVTIEIGANDACRTDVAKMTSPAKFATRLRAALDTLHAGLANARVFIASIPDVLRLWQVGHGSRMARFTWSHLHICQALLANSDSTAPADVARRQAVHDRVAAYNGELAVACTAYGPNCRYDGGAVFAEPFTEQQISKWDWFHPNVYGQHRLAEVTWRAGFFG